MSGKQEYPTVLVVFLLDMNGLSATVVSGRKKGGIMKKLITILMVAGFAAGAFGAEGWLTDFNEAKKQAVAKNLPILVDFSGSDWCGWCIKLDNEVFSQDAFKAYAEENLILFLADFPNSTPQPEEVKAQNKALAEKYGVRGFPTVLLLDAEGNVLERTGYQRGGPEKYVEHIKELLK
jgi:thioredoxin-related protein